MASSALAPSGQGLCGQVRLGMTIEEIETATQVFQGWEILRHDGTLILSAHPHYSGSAVCRIAIDPTTHRAESKSVGPVQQGDWPTL